MTVAPRLHAPGRVRGEHPGQELVLGRYRLIERLGAGGFGVVWRAHDELLHRHVAVKRVWLGPGGDSERATREAQAAARLSHPAIVALHEAAAVQGAFYLISELVEGDTLARLIAGGELEDAEVFAIGLALAHGLAHAHARGVIHRDIKPQNVLVPADGRGGAQAAKLTDFGGASLAGEEALTRTGDVLGTLAYMAPEQSEGRDVGEPADLYALALVLYEALSGANPVRGATPAATAKRIGSRLPSLARARRDLPRTLTDAIDTALAPAPRARGSLQDLAQALEEALAEEAEEAQDDHRGARRYRRGEERRRSAALLPAVPDWTTPHEARTQTARAPRRSAAPTRLIPPLRSTATATAFAGREDLQERPAAQLEPAVDAQSRSRTLTLPRGVWIAGTLLLAGWQAALGRTGLALLLLVALAPLLVLASARAATGARVRVGWLGCALAPILGVIGLAGVFPAIAGQARSWRTRALAGALGYWWLTLAEPLAGRRLWLGVHAGTPPRAVWEPSLASTASHVVGPALGLGLLLGALLWACGAAVLPWLVRGRSAPLDVVAVTVWSAVIAAAAPALDAGLRGAGHYSSPHGVVLGAILGALVAVAVRALRGPV